MPAVYEKFLNEPHSQLNDVHLEAHFPIKKSKAHFFNKNIGQHSAFLNIKWYTIELKVIEHCIGQQSALFFWNMAQLYLNTLYLLL